MERKKSKGPYVVMVILLILIIVLLMYIVPYRYQLNNSVDFDESKELLNNPLTGYAPPAENREECEDSELVYINLTWSMWEPTQGVYDITAMEEKFHIKEWKKQHKHAVLRFVCDYPGKTEHKDIPEWLYQKTKDGEFYNTGYGMGYSPDYSNDFFRERHQLAIEALADYCNKDDFVSYVELGSLGHWGEWHTNTDEGLQPLPDAEICWDYVLDYSDSFHNVRLLMRRNYVMAAEGGLGIFNDMIGSEEDTAEWMDWIKNGGSFETAGKPLEFEPMEDFWKTAPCGGEFTSRYPMEELLSERLNDTLEMIRGAHTTFIGPKCPDEDLKDGSVAKAIRSELGYRYYISRLRTQYLFSSGMLEVSMTWENTGLAPIYWDWPATMCVYGLDGKLKYWENIDINLSELSPGETIETLNHIPFTDELRQGYRIGIRITDPDEEEYILLAMEGERIDDVQIIYSYNMDQ